jgi:hypothetical protein
LTPTPTSRTPKLAIGGVFFARSCAPVPATLRRTGSRPVGPPSRLR